MAESTLSIGLIDLAEEVAYNLGFERVPPLWTGWNPAAPYVPLSKSSQLGDVIACVKQGLRRFYTPPSDGTMPPHRWSFLSPERTLTTVVGQTDYNLPDDHGGFLGDMTYASTANKGVVVQNTGVGRIRRDLQLSGGLESAPQLFAESPLPNDGAQGQRFEVVFYPIPDDAYVLLYRCNVLTQMLTAQSPYPYGGEQHGDTIMASCLAAAESHVGNENGPWTALFKERLLASITADARDHRPEYLGYNRDRSDDTLGNYTGTFWGPHTWTNLVTYNGTSF